MSIVRSYGARLNDEGKKRFMAVSLPEVSLPASVDYMYGFNIPNQNALGVCVSEGWRKHFNFIASKRTGKSFSVSARAIFAQARAQTDPEDTTDSGLAVSSGATVLEEFYVDESDYPSTDCTSESDFPQWLVLPPDNLKKNDFLLRGTASIPEISVLQAKLAVYKNGPLVVGANWSSDWEAMSGESLSECVLPNSGSIVGGHCFNIVGYQDDESVDGGGYFIVANSWGTDWAYKGFAAMAYAALAPWVTDLYTVIA